MRLAETSTPERVTPTSGTEVSSTWRSNENENVRVPARVARTTFWSRSLYHRRM
jgi:hypothetical protein